MKQLAAMERRIQRISSSCLLLYCVFAFVNRACQLLPLLLSSPFAFFISFERYAQPPIERKINHAYIDRSSRYAIEIPRVIFCYREGSGGRNERERGGERKRNERLIPFLHVSAAIVAQRIRFLILWKKHARVSRSHV